MTYLGRLRLFHAESYRVEVSKPSVRTFLIRHTSAMLGFVTPAMLMGRSIDPDPFSDPPPGTQSTNTTFAPHATCLRCKMCRRVLANDEDVTQHAPGKGELSFEPHKRESVRKGLDSAPLPRQRGTATDGVALPYMSQAAGVRPMQRGLLHSAACSAYFVEPLEWMKESSDLVEGFVSGRLICPNPHCHAKLGNWTWAGTQCGWYVHNLAACADQQWRMGHSSIRTSTSQGG